MQRSNSAIEMIQDHCLSIHEKCCSEKLLFLESQHAHGLRCKLLARKKEKKGKKKRRKYNVVVIAVASSSGLLSCCSWYIYIRCRKSLRNNINNEGRRRSVGQLVLITIASMIIIIQ